MAERSKKGLQKVRKPARRKLPPCFSCGNYLWNRVSQALVSKLDGHARLFHRNCAAEELRNNPDKWEDLNAAK